MNRGADAVVIGRSVRGEEVSDMSTAAEAAANAGELLTSMWWLTSAEDAPLPVDPVQIAHSLGVQVVEEPLPIDVSGSIQRDAGSAAVIKLNVFDSENRRRFTCAHEVGHYRARVAQGSAEFAFIDFRSTLASAGTDQDEVWANQFAASLLMPEHLVVKWYSQGVDVDRLARLFGTSVQAMQLRLRNLRLA